MSVAQWFFQWGPPQVVYSNVAENFVPREYLDYQWPSPDPRNAYAEVSSHPLDNSNSKEIFDDDFWTGNGGGGGGGGGAAVNSDNNYGQFQDNHHNYKPNVPGAGPVSSVALWLTLLGLTKSQVVPADVDTPPFSTLYKWKQIDFEFPSAKLRRMAIASEKYIPENCLPLGIEVWGSRVWVTLPSWRQGVPATLATVSKSGGTLAPLLRPYPSWDEHRLFNNSGCDGLTSVFRISADPCGRLWVLDSGQIDSQSNPKQICPPSIVVFDLRSDKLLARYNIPEEFVLQDSLFSNLVIDTRSEDCSDLHAYIADTWRFGLLVFRHSSAKFWRYNHHLFFPDPIASNYTLHDLNFQWTDGIFGLALSPISDENDRFLYFHSMSSYMEFFVPTSVIRDYDKVNDSTYEFNILGESRGVSGQSSASAVDRRGVMFYGLVTRDSIGCWNTKQPYLRTTLGVVAKNTETLIFPNDVKVDQEQRQSVWVISNRLPMFQAGPLDPHDYNFRIMYADTAEAVRGTVCDPDSYSYTQK